MVEPLARRTMLSYSAPALVSAIMHGPASGILTGIMAVHYGIALSAVGTVLLVVRLFDAITDPLIGYASDHTHSRYGRRKPWVVCGYLLALFSMYFLYVPVGRPTGIYFGVWYALLYLGWTMAEIPIQAWGLELSRDPKQRMRLTTYRTIFGLIGGLVFALVPLAPIFATSEYTPAVLEFVAWLCIAALPIAVMIMVWFTPEGAFLGQAESYSLMRLAKSVWSNRPLLWLIGGQVCLALVVGMQQAGYYIWAQSFLRIGDKLPYMMVIITIGGFVATPICLKIVLRLGHLRSIVVGYAVAGGVVMAGYLLEPGPWAFPGLLAIYAILAFTSPIGAIASTALWGDIVDYGLLRTREDQTAQYTAILVLISKSVNAVGGAIVLFTMAMFGVDVQAKSFSGMESFGLRFSVLLLPGFVSVVVALIFIHFPLRPHHGEIIRRRLQDRSRRLEART